MGRKRVDIPKGRVKLSVDQKLLDELEKDGINKSRLFSISARLYLRKKRSKYKKK